jgi:speckle-type POZ protein
MRSSIVITVEDMEPDVFKALLHFIYKDSLPAMDDLDGGEDMEMVKHLLVAADRYAVERMKLICESILCKGLQVDSVAATLALADQHHCSKLREACAAFITSPDRIDDVVATKEYNHLKRVCPDVFMDVWEKVAKSRKSH